MESRPEGEALAPESAPEAPMGFAQRLVGVTFEPKKTFEDINRKSTWLGVFIIISVLTMAMSYALNARMDRETRVRKGLEMFPIHLSEEQIQQAVARPPGFLEKFGFVFAPLGVLVQFYVLAAVFLLAFVLTGASMPYKKTLSTSYWALAPPSIVAILLAILFIFVKDPDTLELNPVKNVASNLGLLVSEKAHPVLNSLLGSIDIFSIWNIVLLSIGFAAISDRKLTTRKSATIVIVLWGLWVLAKAGYSALF